MGIGNTHNKFKTSIVLKKIISWYKFVACYPQFFLQNWRDTCRKKTHTKRYFIFKAWKSLKISECGGNLFLAAHLLRTSHMYIAKGFTKKKNRYSHSLLFKVPIFSYMFDFFCVFSLPEVNWRFFLH